MERQDYGASLLEDIKRGSSQRVRQYEEATQAGWKNIGKEGHSWVSTEKAFSTNSTEGFFAYGNRFANRSSCPTYNMLFDFEYPGPHDNNS